MNNPCPRRNNLIGALWLAVSCAGLIPMPVQGGQPVCPIDGDVVHWIADYCMATIGTDDEIAASACIDQESEVRFASACSAKEHYKRQLCGLMIANGSVTGPVEACVADPAFEGRTVREGGVGR